MQKTLELEVRAFFFNAKTDYLPYYKNFTMTLNSDDSVEAILAEIKKQNEIFAYPAEKLIFKINDYIVDASVTVGDVVNRFGETLQIDPALSYRSNDCLIMDNSDFMKSFELLAPYANDEDKAYYESLYATHYASETFKFSHDYIGDAILLLAYKMIDSDSEHKEAILKVISEHYDGLAACEYENNLFKAEHHATKINLMNGMIKYPTANSLLSKFNNKLSQKALWDFKKDTVIEVNVACYEGGSSNGTEIKQKIIDSNAKLIHFSREAKLAGTSLIGKQNNLAYLKAATTMLDALDSGAELLVVAQKADLEMFRTHFASIQKRIGREIPIPLVSYKEFLELCDKEKVTKIALEA